METVMFCLLFFVEGIYIFFIFLCNLNTTLPVVFFLLESLHIIGVHCVEFFPSVKPKNECVD